MAVEFEITDTAAGAGTHVVSVRGEIDLFTAPEFKQRIGTAIDDGATNVVVDLTETRFIDSSSLGVLIAAHKRLKLRDGLLSVVANARPIVNTFKVTGLDGVFRMTGTLDEALKTEPV